MSKATQKSFAERKFPVLGAALGFVATLSLIGVPETLAAAPTSTNVQVNLEPSISLSLLASSEATEEISNLNFELDPNGELVAKNMVARVSTNSPRYKLTLEMTSSVTDLVQSGATRQIVGTVTDGVTAAAMAPNSWGYSMNATNYSKVPARGSAVVIKADGEQTTSEEDLEGYEDSTVTFGVKVDNDVQTGNYNGVVLFTAVTLDENGDEN